MGHSYGNKMILNLLNSMEKPEKENLIQEYVAVGPPLLGSTNSLYCLTGSRSFLYFSQLADWTKWKWLGHQFDGFNAYYSAELLSTLDYVYEFLHHPPTIEKEYSAFTENRALLKGNVSNCLLSSVNHDYQHISSGDIITKQYGETTDFKGNFIQCFFNPFSL